jgi:PleD family two-component response regulator
MTHPRPAERSVDDSTENLALLGELLDMTHRVRVATSDIQALSAAHAHPPSHKTS